MAELTAQGFKTRTLEEIVNEISGNLKASFGANFDTSPESPDGQLIGIFAEQIYRADMAGQAVYQSSDPDRASGEALEYVCDYNGVYRERTRPTIVYLMFKGVVGTQIPSGVVVSTEDGLEFSTDAIGVVGTLVSATCTRSGRFLIDPNEVTQIKTPVPNITGVSNPSSGVAGTEVESDATLRNRRSFSVVDKGSNTIESIYSDLMKGGAEFVSIIQNVKSTEGKGLPPKSFLTVVKGLTDEQVFQSIFENKPAGIQAYGLINGVVQDSKNYPHDIAFSRPKDVPIDIKVTFTKKRGSPNDIIEYITKGITHDLNAYQNIGQEVLWSDVMGTAIYASNGGPSIADPVDDGVSTSIRSVVIKRADGGAFGMADLVMNFDEKAVAGNIDVTEVVK